jgi:succinyl-diaminopimelate desuccinylase
MDLADDLVQRLLEQCALVCTTGDEAPVADAVADHHEQRGEEVVRVGNSVVVGERTSDRDLVVLVGHLDVVPATADDLAPRVEVREDGPVVVGRGSSDMKGGNVVAMSLMDDTALRSRSPYDLALVLYAGEEGPADGNELVDVLNEVTWLREASLAVVLEPTDGEVQVGCLGGLHARVTFAGRNAHSARPWDGHNPVLAAAHLLSELADDHVREVTVDGVAYRDVWSVTQAWTTGLGPGPHPPVPPARNVLPSAFTLNLNFRFAPDRSLDDAERELRERIGDRASVQVVDRSPPAPPRLDTPIVRRFVEMVGAEVAGKQAWTDVARFAELGVPALNFGPGLAAQAHQAGEFVPVASIVETRERLARFLGGSA